MLVKTTRCPDDLYRTDPSDRRYWFGGLVRCQRECTKNLQNHKFQGLNVVQCLKEKITKEVSNNPALTRTDITCGKGLGFIDSVCSHFS